MNKHQPHAVAVALVCLAALTLVDFLTGFEISFALFYVFPIAFVAWYGGRTPAIVMSIASAIAWEEANRLAGQTFSSSFIPLWNATTRLGFFLIISELLCQLRRTLRREQALSRTDALTGIKNRRAFEEDIRTELARANRYKFPLTVIYIDLDNFKFVNDKFGHAVGDELLYLVATTLRGNLRITDTVARLGGDEFAILLPETDAAATKNLVVKNHQILLDEMRRHNWPVTFSIGVLSCLVAPQSVEEMLRIADDLMYNIKANGKNAIRYGDYGSETPKEG